MPSATCSLPLTRCFLSIYCAWKTETVRSYFCRTPRRHIPEDPLSERSGQASQYERHITFTRIEGRIRPAVHCVPTDQSAVGCWPTVRLTSILEVLGSNLVQDTGYPN